MGAPRGRAGEPSAATHAPGTPELPSDAILTVPNLITFTRIALLPVFVWLALGAHRIGAAFWLAAAIGASDYVDGIAARALHQVSRLGTTIDPLFDRLAVAAAVVVLIGLHLAPWEALAVVLFRDAVLVVAGAVLGSRGVARPPVSRWGKWGSFGTMWSLGLLLASGVDAGIRHPFRVMGWTLFVPAMVFSYLAATGYAREAVQSLRARGAPG
jgi:cardiolipin synthase (CMP-forming)